MSSLPYSCVLDDGDTLDEVMCEIEFEEYEGPRDILKEAINSEGGEVTFSFVADGKEVTSRLRALIYKKGRFYGAFSNPLSDGPRDVLFYELDIWFDDDGKEKVEDDALAGELLEEFLSFDLD